MKKLELKEKIQSNLPRNEIKARILDFFDRSQIKIKEANERLTTGMYGSRLKAHMRGILADPSILPVKVSINEQPTSNDTELDVQMKEGFFGITPLALNKKYSKTFTRLMNNFKSQFSNDIISAGEKSTCDNCGVAIVDSNQGFCDLCGQQL